jgi:dTDP-4-dehydrorhamnose reductase
MLPDFASLAQPARLLITGVDWPLGGCLAVTAAHCLDVVGLCSDGHVALEGCRVERFEPEDREAFRRQIRKESPQWIVHCGPMSRGSWDLSEETPDGRAEARLCAFLAEMAAEIPCRLTVLTSDAVFAGPRLFHSERETPGSREPFARAVRQVERALAGTDALVVRTHAYGWSPRSVTACFAQRIWESLLAGQPCRLSTECHAAPILAHHLAELLLEAYRRDLRGLYHLAGAERSSPYRFAQNLAAAAGLRTSLILPDDAPEQGTFAPAMETSLNTQKARADLGLSMPMLREGLEELVLQARNGYRDRLRGGVERLVRAA